MTAQYQFEPPYDHDHAIMAIAARDPALASILIHHHRCLEETKTVVATIRDEFSSLKSLALKGLLWSFGILISGFSAVVWAVITHGGLRQ